MYRVPTYQREYSWQKGQWEDLFEDLVEADGAHFLGTIITLDQTTDQLAGGVLEVIDGQQRLTTLTLLLLRCTRHCRIIPMLSTTMLVLTWRS